MRKIRIEIEEDALYEAKQIFSHSEEFVSLLNRMGRLWKHNRCDKRYFCYIAQTEGEWRRFRDYISNTRTAFVEEYYRGEVILVIKHILPRTSETYNIFQYLHESCLT